jgi:hypothetical protein
MELSQRDEDEYERHRGQDEDMIDYGDEDEDGGHFAGGKSSSEKSKMTIAEHL